jgi:hypothetical protein
MQTQNGDDFDDNSSTSDYGSDFTPDEEELLNELLTRVATQQQTTVVTNATTNPSTPPAIEAIELADLQPLQDPLVVTDIEDYEVPQAVRLPKVLGRESWSPLSPRNKGTWHQISPLLQNSDRQLPGSVAGHPRSTAGTSCLPLAYSFFFLSSSWKTDILTT